MEYRRAGQPRPEAQEGDRNGVKRGGPVHPKIEHLQRILGITRYRAVGLMECLYHLAYATAPNGDIGKLPSMQIASYIGWEGDPEILLDAMVEARLVSIF